MAVSEEGWINLKLGPELPNQIPLIVYWNEGKGGMGKRGGKEEKGAQRKMRHMEKGEYNIWSQKDLMDAYYVKNILYSQCPPIKMVNSKHFYQNFKR
jgi:hypothetical protein